MYVRTFFLRIWCELVDYPHKEKTGVINYSKLELIIYTQHAKSIKGNLKEKKSETKKTLIIH